MFIPGGFGGLWFKHRLPNPFFWLPKATLESYSYLLQRVFPLNRLYLGTYGPLEFRS